MTTVYTDGACKRNPGPGGFGAVILRAGGAREEIGGHDPDTTNNRMELRAAIAALERLPAGEAVTVRSDSEYLVKGMTSWVAGWRRRGWKTREGKDVLNRDLWEELAALAGRRARFEHVRGHAGNPLNERCDTIARAFSEGRTPALEGTGPAPTAPPSPAKSPPAKAAAAKAPPAKPPPARSPGAKRTAAAALVARRDELLADLCRVQAELFRPD